MRRLLQLRGSSDRWVVTNDLGEFVILDSAAAKALRAQSLPYDHPHYLDLEARGLLEPDGPKGGLADIVRRTRKAFLREDPSLHIFVVTLRCDHSCQYCQVSRASLNARGKDMSWEDAQHAIARVCESAAPAITVEFQGGEPALRFDLVRTIVEELEARFHGDDRSLQFTMATTLHLLSDDDLVYCHDHSIHLSTSLDGAEEVHAKQRVLPGENSWAKTISAIDRARTILGEGALAALPTITRAALTAPETIVDAYVRHGFRAIFLRPLAPYGFARKTRSVLGYSMAEFNRFYAQALEHILMLNQSGVEVEETMAAIVLRHILTPFHSGYMDLRSPAGAGLGVLVYNYDGGVYPSDEARMAAETGDGRFRLGSVKQPLDELLESPAMKWLARGAVAEVLPGCTECAYVPYCGADPVHHAMVDGDPAFPRAGTDFCDRHKAVFDILFNYIADDDPETMRTFQAWAFGVRREEANPHWMER